MLNSKLFLSTMFGLILIPFFLSCSPTGSNSNEENETPVTAKDLNEQT